jgi:hypothetical protein
MMIGDFNETKWQHEHFSETKRSERRMSEFRKVLEDYNLHDIRFSGPPWTFDNKRKDANNVKARIDRAVASPDWSTIYPDAKLTHVCSTRSDHLPLVLECQLSSNRSRPPPIPRYEAMWERDLNLPGIIEDAWNNGPTCHSLAELVKKIDGTRSQLHEWSSEHFPNVTKEIRNKRKKLEKLWKRQKTPSRESEVRRISADLDELLQREELMWRQRSRITWLKEGDRNTSFFHRKAS